MEPQVCKTAMVSVQYQYCNIQCVIYTLVVLPWNITDVSHFVGNPNCLNFFTTYLTEDKDIQYLNRHPYINPLPNDILYGSLEVSSSYIARIIRSVSLGWIGRCSSFSGRCTYQYWINLNIQNICSWNMVRCSMDVADVWRYVGQY